ncbi:hypothetical protein RFI_35559, partial [Reticulomyxa filosa]
MSKKNFETLKDLPIPLPEPQCVLHKDEILICGGRCQSGCYSYNTYKDSYKFICDYPSNVKLDGHCVVNLVNNNSEGNDEITLLSFGGLSKHTLIMKYVSVWSDNNNKNGIKRSKKLKKCNQWVPFTDNKEKVVKLGKQEDRYEGARAVIGGGNDHLLFITYQPKNISVFDLNTFQFIKHDTLPIDNEIYSPCFVSISENEQEMIRGNKKNKKNKKLLFHKKAGLLIKYDETKNNFRYYVKKVCKDIAPFWNYGYVRINDIILFFGGWSSKTGSKSVYKYSIPENKWMTFQDALPTSLDGCVAMLSKDSENVHVIGVLSANCDSAITHLKTKKQLSVQEKNKKRKEREEEEEEREEEEEEAEEEEEVEEEVE